MTEQIKQWDVIVVGAGLSGLSCAAKLAKKGVRVLVLERGAKVGGYATQFTRKARKGIEYRFDVSLQLVGALREGGILRMFLEDVSVFDDLEYKSRDEITTVKLPDFEMAIPKGLPLLQEQLIERVPAEKEGIEKLFGTLASFQQEDAALKINPQAWSVGSKEFAEQYPIYSKYRSASNDDLFADFIQDPKIIGVLNFLCPPLGPPPNQLSAVMFMSVFSNMITDGVDYIQGGGYALSKAFQDAIVRYGGQVFVKNEVEQILIEHGKCEGVRTEKGDLYKAPIVVCNAPAPVVFEKLVDPKLVDPHYLHQIRTPKISKSLLLGLFGLKGTPEEVGFTKGVYVFDGYDFNDGFKQLMVDEDYENGHFFLTNNTVDNPDDTPEGRTILQLLMPADGKHWCGLNRDVYKKKKAEVTEVLIDRVGEFIPDIRDRLEVTVVATPRTFERYTLNPNGAVLAYDLSTTGYNFFRPRRDTPVPGLYLASAWTSNGPSYIATVIGGIETAGMILANGPPSLS